MAKMKDKNLKRLRSDISVSFRINSEGEAYKFSFKKGRRIVQVVNAMRNVARAFGYTPLELYNPRGLNLPHFLTDAEIKQYNDKVKEMKDKITAFAEEAVSQD